MEWAAGLVAAAWLLAACPANAQWYVAGQLGANHTLPATVSIDQPSRQTSLQFDDVHFVAHPFESPQYYSVRGGRLFGDERRWGVEVEWVHPKVYAETSEQVRVSGRIAGAPVDATTRMDTFVQRYSMSHGMNFVLVNVVARVPIARDGGGDSRLALIARAGAGPMLPHGETEVGGTFVEGYEWAGLGSQFAGGLDVRLVGRLSGTLEYRFSHARPEITIANGTGRTTANAHQITFGVAYGLAR
jgi:opacity protein-like surface antigen